MPILASQRPTLRLPWVGVQLLLLLLLAAGALLLITDRPGLEARYFALGTPLNGKQVYQTLGEPALRETSQVMDILMAEVGFGIRWTGWWDVAQSGDHRFSLDADDFAYVRVADELIIDAGGVFGAPITKARVALEPGFHKLEVGFFQRDGEGRLAVQWTAPGSSEAMSQSLPSADLYSGWPASFRKTLRRAFASWSRPYRQLFGALLVIAVVLTLPRLLTPWLERSRGRARARLEVLARPRWRAALLVGFFFAVFLASLPFTGALRGGDDAAYLSAAAFNTTGKWFSNRYGHVYLLKLFTTLCGGNPLIGVRVWWSFAFAATVAGLAVAVRSVGPGLQLRTLAATLFLLFSQTTMMGLIGNGFADFSAMMFVTLAVTVYMHGFVSAAERASPRHQWHALAIGALTIGALRSKEVGAVLLLLPPLFLLVDGRLDLRRFVRRLVYWAMGAAGALGLVILVDGLIFGDFLLTIGDGRLGTLGKMNFPAGRAPDPNADWLRTIWFGRSGGSALAMRFLWLGVAAAAVVAGVRRRCLELRLLHLLPIAYLVALIALYVRLPHPFSPRMLITILPVACLMAGLLLHYAGLDELPWRRLLAPAVLIPAGLLAALVVFILIPYRLGTLEAADFLPVTYLERFGWTPEHFAVGVLLPAAVLAAVAIMALGAGQRPMRVAALVVAFLALFGTGFGITRKGLAAHHSVQVSNLLSYPWRVFEDELTAPSAQTIWLSKDLLTRNKMSAQTRSSLARLNLGRLDVWVKLTRVFPAGSEVAIASLRSWRRWRRELSPPLQRALEASAKWDSLGLIVLLRPREATELADRLGWEHLTAQEIPDLHQSLVDLARNPDDEARDHLLGQILGSESNQSREGQPPRGQGDRVVTMELTPDGWTSGVRPAGIIVTNSGDSSLVQELRLSVAALAGEYPIRVFIDDGGQLETIVFERAEARQVELPPVRPRSERLFIVWTDTSWSPEGSDTRQLGVRILPPDER